MGAGPTCPRGGAPTRRDWTQKKFVPSSELDARARDDGPVVGRSDGVQDWGKEKRDAPPRPFPEDDRPTLGRSDSVENWAKEKASAAAPASGSPAAGGPPARSGWRDAPGDRLGGERG